MVEIDFEMDEAGGPIVDLAPVLKDLSDMERDKATTPEPVKVPEKKKLTFKQRCQQLYRKDSKLRPARSKVRLTRVDDDNNGGEFQGQADAEWIVIGGDVC
jgi:hypothetical protein